MTRQNNQTVLSEIRDALASITQGQWRIQEMAEYDSDTYTVDVATVSGIIASVPAYHEPSSTNHPNPANAHFIANAPHWMKLLLDVATAANSLLNLQTDAVLNAEQIKKTQALRSALKPLKRIPNLPNRVNLMFGAAELNALQMVYNVQEQGNNFTGSSLDSIYPILKKLSLQGWLDIHMVNMIENSVEFHFRAIVTTAGLYLIQQLEKQSSDESLHPEPEPVE